ncbi:Translocon-associated protein subunit delta [Halotydeus destructor]|nr:Translocon-associated protein subunit delta [Halotydeus destructor]
MVSPTLMVLGLAALSCASACQVKDVKSTSYTTTDGYVVSSVAYIATFTLQCSSGPSDHLTLFSQLTNGQVVPVTTSLEDNKYQVSWTEELAKASSGPQLVKIYDQAGYSQIQKNEREGVSGQEVKPITTVTINHPGASKGWNINFQAVLTLVAVGVYYLAHSAKSNIVS